LHWKKNKTNENGDLKKSAFQFLIPARQSLKELAFVVIFSSVFACISTIWMHQNFMFEKLDMNTPCMRETNSTEDSGYRCDYAMRPGELVPTSDVSVCQAYSFIVLFLCTYSLISKPFPEHANYDND
jgi:hypothetical protein